MLKILSLPLAMVLLFSGSVLGQLETGQSEPVPPLFAGTVTVPELFFTPRDENDNVDSVATWHGPDGEHWLIATAKETNRVLVYDAVSGKPLRKYGETGDSLGQFRRPNGISVRDDFLFVVERDNQRVQVLRLPGFDPVLTFGSIGTPALTRPYGLWVKKIDASSYHVYISDNYETPQEGVPPLAELDRRVQRWQLSKKSGKWTARQQISFGATKRPGALTVVESLYGDPDHERLLVADEEEFQQRNIKVYDLHGKYTGRRMGAGVFRFQPEGIALVACADGSGYWITTDQSDARSYFHVFERASLDYFATFQGRRTANTDGIWLTRTPMPGLPGGAFYAVHDDGNVAAFDLDVVLASLGTGNAGRKALFDCARFAVDGGYASKTIFAPIRPC